MKIKLTAQFTTSVTREIEVDDDFIPITCDINDLWFNKGGSSLTSEELQEAYANLEFDEVWLVRNSKDEDLLVK